MTRRWTTGTCTPILTDILWADFKRRAFNRNVDLVKKWFDNGIAYFVIDTPMLTDTIATRFREVGGKHVSVRYISKQRIQVAISAYEE